MRYNTFIKDRSANKIHLVYVLIVFIEAIIRDMMQICFEVLLVESVIVGI